MQKYKFFQCAKIIHAQIYELINCAKIKGAKIRGAQYLIELRYINICMYMYGCMYTHTFVYFYIYTHT